MQLGAGGDRLVSEQLRLGRAAAGRVDRGLHAQPHARPQVPAAGGDVAVAHLLGLHALGKAAVKQVDDAPGLQAAAVAGAFALGVVPAQRHRPAGLAVGQRQRIAEAHRAGVEDGEGIARVEGVVQPRGRGTEQRRAGNVVEAAVAADGGRARADDDVLGKVQQQVGTVHQATSSRRACTRPKPR